MKLRTLIVDDETLARERLRRLLSAFPDVEILGEAANGTDAVESVKALRPAVVFLDVQMPGMDGFEVVRALNAATAPVPLIVFVTGFDQHAVRAFEARALDYLLKPTNKTRLAEAVRRARERLAATAPGKPGLPQALLDLLAERDKAAAPPASRLAVRGTDGVVFVPLEEIDWIEAAGNYAILHTGKTTHILRETMSALEGQMCGAPFMRISRSAIVNLSRVREIQAQGTGDHAAVLAGGQRLAITRNLREVEERLRFA